MDNRTPRQPHEKILRRSLLTGQIKSLRQAGKKIVFTNGCFDVIHVGHIRHLRDARGLGDCLVVGINSDESVRTLKGEPRPLVPELERAEILAGLEYVDYVVIFNEPTADNIILELKPQVYAKRADYGPEKVPELQTVLSYGGKMEYIGVTEGRSTTSLVTKILTVHSQNDGNDGG